MSIGPFPSAAAASGEARMTLLPGARRVLLAALAAAALGASAPAHADDDGERSRRVPLLPAYQQECGACHVAYPPGMLPAASWQRLMSDIPNHFGTDASLDAEMVATLAAYLQAHAGSSRKPGRAGAAPPEDRITRSAWFVHEHDEVPPAAWKLPAVKSPSNCAACHRAADQGDFDDDHVRIPR